jgi:hypothetical protein
LTSKTDLRRSALQIFFTMLTVLWYVNGWLVDRRESSWNFKNVAEPHRSGGLLWRLHRGMML